MNQTVTMSRVTSRLAACDVTATGSVSHTYRSEPIRTEPILRVPNGCTRTPYYRLSDAPVDNPPAPLRAVR